MLKTVKIGRYDNIIFLDGHKKCRVGTKKKSFSVGLAETQVFLGLFYANLCRFSNLQFQSIYAIDICKFGLFCDLIHLVLDI